jgi:predicted acylesterase/phospholipase RssA
VPLITIVIVFAVLWSLFDVNDNHGLRVRRLAAGLPRLDITTDFERWLNSRKDLDRYDTYPVIIVAAEGGGVRAGYFTARVLALLQDRCPVFAQHLYAISAVSGGSVGATVFGSLAADYGRNVESQPCDFGLGKELPLAERASRVLAHDLLTPMVATTLFPDFVQRFVPAPFPSVDRALTLEQSLEMAWERVRKGEDGEPAALKMTPDALAGSFYGMAARREEGAFPALLLNTTHVESGNRMVLSPITARGNALRELDILVDALPYDDIRPSTAAFASARFPYVTPAASVWRAPQHPEDVTDAVGRKMRYVDGGYYDNAGTATLSDLFEALRSFHPDLKGGNARLKRFRVAVIWIGNEPVVDPKFPSTQPLRMSGTGLGESASPLRAVMNARSARADESVRRLQHTVDLTRKTEDRFTAQWTEFRLLARGIPLPLGWLLSKNAREEIDDQLPAPEDCGISPYPLVRIEPRHNACAFGEVIAQLTAERKNPKPQ